MKDIGGVGMISFIICLALLIGGYFVYGKVVENTFAPDDRETPAVRINDGVDYVVMPQWKLFLVQLLNIAGLDQSSELCREHCGDRLYSCGLHSVRFLQVVYMTIFQVSFLKEMTEHLFPKCAEFILEM